MTQMPTVSRWLAAVQQQCPNVLGLLADVRCLILDVDGVLTDGRLYYGQDGQEELKVFNSLDGHGIKMLASIGIEVAIITGRQSKMVEQRAKELQIAHLYMGVHDKTSALSQLLVATHLTEKQCAYMGDDWPDLPVMCRVGFAACPANAHLVVKDSSHYVSVYTGGEGAVREICDLIVLAQGAYERLQSNSRT